MSNTIWHSLADEWETRTSLVSNNEIRVYKTCAQELRALTDKWEADMKKIREVRDQEDREWMAGVRELAKRYGIIFPKPEINTI